MTVLQEVEAAEARLQRAVLERDLQALNDLLADDVAFVGPDGATMDKATDLETHRSGRLRVHALVPESLVVQPVADDVAVVRLRAAMRVTFDGGDHEGTFRYLRVYARRAGRWQVAYAQADPGVGRASDRVD